MKDINNIDDISHIDKYDELYLCDIYNKGFELGLIDLSCVNDNLQTLYHIAIACNNHYMFSKLIEYDNQCERYSNLFNNVTFLCCPLCVLCRLCICSCI